MAFTRAIAAAVRRDLARIDATNRAVNQAREAGRHHARDGFTRRAQWKAPALLLAGAFIAGAEEEARKRQGTDKELSRPLR